MRVCVEMAPKDFILSTRITTFQNDEDVDIVLPKGLTLTGRVVSSKNATYGKNTTPGTRIKIAITSSNIAQHKENLSGAIVTGKRSKAQGEIYENDRTKFTFPMVKLQFLIKVVNEIETLVKRASQLKNDTSAKLWFGDNLTKVQLQRIHYDAKALHEGLGAVKLMRFVCRPSSKTNEFSIASCNLNDKSLYKPTICEVRLGKGFNYSRYSWGEKICTLIHEFSHWFIGTTDETYQGEDAYGIKAFDMVKDPSTVERRKCLNNAENWGYYICSYRDSSSDGDWKNMTRNELARRQPFNSEVQRLNPAIVHLV